MEFQFRVNFSSSTRSESPLPLLFVARMMVIFLLWVRGMEHILPPFLPFIPPLDALRGASGLFRFLDWVYWVSLVMTFTGIRFRFFSLVIGLLIFLSILFSKVQFSNSFLYSGCIFFLIGIFKPGLEWVFRVQIALLYLGAGLNKLFDPDWLSGQYFDFFFSKPFPNQLYLSIASELPPKSLAIFLSFFTIVTEFGFGFWALLNRKIILLVILIHLFHLLMLVVTAGELSYLFYFLMAMSSYLILPWEKKKGREILSHGNSKILELLRILDFDNFFTWKTNLSQDQVSHEGERLRFGFSFYLQTFLFHKFVVGVWVLTVVFLSIYRNHLLTFFLK